MEVVAELSEPVEWRGWGWPHEVSVSWSQGGVVVSAHGVVTDDGIVCRSVTLIGDNLRAADLRGPILSVFADAVSAAAMEARSDGGYTSRQGRRRRVPSTRGHPPNPRAAAQRLDEVAKVAANAMDQTPTQAVAAYFAISQGYARRLIRLAGSETV